MKIDVLSRAKKKKFVEGSALRGCGGFERLKRIAITVVVAKEFRYEN